MNGSLGTAVNLQVHALSSGPSATQLQSTTGPSQPRATSLQSLSNTTNSVFCSMGQKGLFLLLKPCLRKKGAVGFIGGDRHSVWDSCG